ncbi:arginine--tRNA ligase, partial [Candidatus Margulisiibacteriota bacterium]
KLRKVLFTSEFLAKEAQELEDKFQLEIPNNSEFGDYASNIAFLLAKYLKKSPKLIAEEISQFYSEKEDLNSVYSFIPTNGFINIKLSDQLIWQEFTNINTKKTQFPITKDKILLEFVSANPTGPLHIGHGRWAAVGDVLRILLEYTGQNVKTEFYVNDAGNQIQNLRASIKAVQNETPIPEDGYHGAYIRDLAKIAGDPVDIMKKQQEKTLKKFGVVFDKWFSETELHAEDEMKKAIKILDAEGLVYESEKALWFRSTNFGDEKDRVLIKADGNYTYFAVDIAYHLDKIERGFTKLINIWGADHHGYVQRVKSAVKAVSKYKFDVDNNFNVIIGQLVSLFRGGELVKMSKRTGEMITLEEVIEEIGKDAARFFLVHKSTDTRLDFDLELAKKKSAENPVYYIQYSHARICSIFKKIGIKPEEIKLPVGPVELDINERNLVLTSGKIFDEVYEAAIFQAPYKFANYTLELAKAFHNFYERCSIMKADDKNKLKRLFIIREFQMILKTALNILGISAPEQM